jgi:hypothetical protein
LEVSGQLHAPAALSAKKEAVLLVGKEAGWTPEPVWMISRSENSGPYLDSNSDLSVVQPVVRSIPGVNYISIQKRFSFSSIVSFGELCIVFLSEKNK